MNHTFITVPRIKKGIFIHTLVDAQCSFFIHPSCVRSFDFLIDVCFSFFYLIDHLSCSFRSIYRALVRSFL